jgi:cysteine desulfurase
MLPHLTEQHGNPHSSTHMYGWENDSAVERARAQIAKLINADPKEVIFTSGATEANNIAIKGVGRFYKDKRPVIVTSVLEHKCVLDSCRKMETEGAKVIYLPVQKNGILDLTVLENTLRENAEMVSVVSVMFVNNEIGVVQPIKEIGALCRKYKTFFHTDAAQCLGKLPIDVNELNIDVMSMSGHKIYGPTGVGAVYIRRKPRVRVEPVQSGGGQERGIRSGTIPTALAVGFGKACEIATEEMVNDRQHAKKLYDRLYNSITSRLDYVYLNGDPDRRWHGNLNLSFAYVEGEALLMGLKNVACSSGSACTSASLEPSYVLRALGVDEELAHTSIRFGISRFTTEQEVDYAADQVVENVMRLRELSPLWDMVQEGVDLKSIQWTQDH